MFAVSNIRFFLLLIILSIFSLSAPTGNADLQEITSVVAQSVQESDFYEIYNSVGQCKAENSKTYHAKVRGVVDSISVFQGRQVKAGDILVKIDPIMAEASKAKAEAAFASARTTFERDISLVNKKVISTELFEKSKVLLESAKADLVYALDKYDNMIIKAPFDGYIGVVHAQNGEDIREGDYLFTIIGGGDKVIFVELPEDLSGKIDNQSRIWLNDTEGNKVFGTLEAVSNYLNDNGTITAKIIFPTDTKILHGSYALLVIEYNFRHGMGVTEKAVLKNNQGNFIYKITEDNKAKQVYIKTGARNNGLIEIESDDLTAEDKVIIEGLTKIQNGTPIKPDDAPHQQEEGS